MLHYPYNYVFTVTYETSACNQINRPVKILAFPPREGIFLASLLADSNLDVRRFKAGGFAPCPFEDTARDR